MKLIKDIKKLTLAGFVIACVCLTSYVLFMYPQPGVADQGDFYRVMSAGGLQLTDSDNSNPDFIRFFKYTITNYKISTLELKDVLSSLLSYTPAYPIIVIDFLCRVFRSNTFKTYYLAIFYGFIYICSLYLIVKYVNIKNIDRLLLALLILLVFFDGNYLVWFNSLYGEPMMITTLVFYISSWVYYIHYKYILKTEEKMTGKIIFIFIAAFLFLGSKLQVITAAPIIITMLCTLLIQNRQLIKGPRIIAFVFALLLIAIYPLQISTKSGGVSNDTKYNSVFFGVLKDSKNPRQDLIDMHLNPDMAVEAGKHSYLEDKYYVKYIPRTPITEVEFYNKITNRKLIEFYLTHPMRLLNGMEYTAEHAFITSTTLGHYPRSFSMGPVGVFSRFTLWSHIRQFLLPKNLFFIITAYITVICISLYTYLRNSFNSYVKALLGLFWSIILIGMLQFPMPFVGNGQADTSKQLFLFNFTFDIMIVVTACWLFHWLIKLFKPNYYLDPMSHEN